MIVNQTEKLKEHDNLFAELSKRPKDQQKMNVLTCNKNLVELSTKCFGNLNQEENSSYLPQLIIQPPTEVEKLSECCKSIEDKETLKTPLKSTKRKIQGYLEDHPNNACKRTRSTNPDEKRIHQH